jgi:flagellar basal-body rod modification protein FlgD
MAIPINSTASIPTAPTGASSPAATPPQTLGKDAFLKLLMAQLKNQDPLAPTDDTQFVTQLSQFSLVEQSSTQSSQLTSIAAQLQNLGNSNATNLVGKTVTVSGSGLSWDGLLATTANVNLGGAAQKVTASITDAQGNVVRKLNPGPQPAGALSITWDGRDDSGQAAPKGNYSVAVSATDGNGQPVSVSQDVTGVVSKVSFEQGSPALNLSNGVVVPVSDLISVGITPTNP